MHRRVAHVLARAELIPDGEVRAVIQPAKALRLEIGIDGRANPTINQWILRETRRIRFRVGKPLERLKCAEVGGRIEIRVHGKAAAGSQSHGKRRRRGESSLSCNGHVLVTFLFIPKSFA
jgi:hypothetical protein